MKSFQLLTLSIALTAAALTATAQSDTNQNSKTMKFTLQPLPYAMDALEPVMGAETFEYHWGKHLKAYVDKTNELIAGTGFENMTLEEIVKKSDGPLFNNAAQVWNHNFFFETFSPNAQTAPEGKLAKQINNDFGSLEAFKDAFDKAGVGLFGSGWVWLAWKDGKLHILSKQNAGNPLTDNAETLLGADVWEHSYYLDYRNVRADYMKGLWKIVDWKVVEDRFGKIK